MDNSINRQLPTANGLYLYTHALKEMFRLRRFLPWIGVAVFIAFMGFMWPNLSPDSTNIQQYSDLSSMLIFRALALASAIYTTSIVSQEVEQKTIVYILTRPVARWKMLLARYLASVTVVSTIAIVCVLFLSAVTFRGNIGENSLLGGDVKAVIVGAFCYGALFLFVSLVSSRAMIICILFAFGWELSMGNLPGDLSYLTVYSYLQSLAQHPAATGGPKEKLLTGELGTAAITPSLAIQVMVITTIALAAICLWWFSHFEYIPREDAE